VVQVRVWAAESAHERGEEMRTKLYAAAANVNIQPTKCGPLGIAVRYNTLP
jgi:hypothetical protein